MTLQRKAILVGAFLGVLVWPVEYLGLVLFDGCGPEKCYWLIWLCPSSILLMALDLVHTTGAAAFVFFAVIALNGLLYAAIGWSVIFIYQHVRAVC